ncbi:CoA-binding protein [Ideonella sp. A 288]|uniref:CoA-binding protein n=1 Tax=Ideonella sp. A 288 TaxID=1962181 RepID=UPI0013039A97|nr:CoA-binding protein [Ideonella sp. A 288]
MGRRLPAAKIAMVHTPPVVADFLSARRVAVAGVSRSGNQPANAILRRLRDGGHDVVAINPHAEQIDGTTCYPDLAAVPGIVDALMVVVPPAAAERLVRQAAARGIARIWFHRSFGDGSVSEAALKACAELGMRPIVGGCPLMYCAPVDVAHRCMRWLLTRRGRVPA